MPSKDELHLFRIVQELFNNSIKHSGAKQVNLTLELIGKELTLRYIDDGKGFDLERARTAKGLGMSGIQNRAVLLNATLEVVTAPNKGIDVTIKCSGTNEN